MSIRYLSDEHLGYWRDRGVSDQITHLNVTTYKDEKTIATLINWKRWSNGSGWVVTGVNPKTGEWTNSGLQFRPDNPLPQRDKQGEVKLNEDGTPKFQKFISRKGDLAAPLFLKMPDPKFWEKVIQTESQPIFILEGAAKAGALLTYGMAAISIPGVTTGQKSDRLKDELLLFYTPGRPIYLAFDADLATNRQVQTALRSLGSLLRSKNCVVYVVRWDVGQGKGADDFIVNQGIEAFEAAIDRASTFKEWIDEIKAVELPKNKKDEVNSQSEDEEFSQIVVKRLYSSEQWICITGQLYRWTGIFYEATPDEAELQRIQKLAEKCGRFNKTLNRITYPFAKASQIKAALEWVKIKFAVSPEQANPPGLNCTNGIRVWNEANKEFELIPHNSQYYYLSQPIVEYDPNASAEDLERLLDALEPAEQEILLRTVAAAFNIDLVRQKHGRLVRAIFAKGVGSNGKDVHREAVAMLWGKTGVCSIAFEDFAQYDQGRKFPLQGLMNARINWSSENQGSINLDRLQSLKKAVTGDPLHFEQKGKDHQEFEPKAIHIFNVNDVPRLTAGLEAIKTRFAVLTYAKVYRKNADPNKGEIEADPRFKYDPDFIKNNILPALLNRLEQAFKDLMAEGIEYSCCDQAMEEIQIHNSHLFEFARETGLTCDRDSTLPINELWERLELWYQKTEILRIETDEYSDSLKRVWAESVNSSDLYVKGSNQVVSRFLKLYPQCSKVSLGGNRYGIKGLRFTESKPNQALDSITIGPIQEQTNVSTERAPINSGSEEEIVSYYRAALNQSQFYADPNTKLIQLLEELKPMSLSRKRAIWAQISGNLKQQIKKILEMRPDLRREGKAS